MRLGTLMLLLCLSAWGGEEGKVYVQSVPSGAEIFLNGDEEPKALNAKTPGMVKLPYGPAVLVLRKEGFADAKIQVVSGAAISKSEVVKLQLPQVEVDVLSAEPGWRLFRGGQPLKDKAGKTAVTPCTILLPKGRSTLGLAKEGFVDITERVTVDEKTEMFEVKAKPRKGRSRLLLMRKELVPGVYQAYHPSWKGKVTLTEDGRIVGAGSGGDRWEFQGLTLTLRWTKHRPERLNYDMVKKEFIGEKAGFRMIPE
jgi:hypothetical protein